MLKAKDDDRIRMAASSLRSKTRLGHFIERRNARGKSFEKGSLEESRDEESGSQMGKNERDLRGL